MGRNSLDYKILELIMDIFLVKKREKGPKALIGSLEGQTYKGFVHYKNRN
jgi:hypothetical protein